MSKSVGMLKNWAGGDFKLIPVCCGLLLVQWDWNVLLMTLYPCRHSFLPDPGATSGQSLFFLSFILKFFSPLFPFKWNSRGWLIISALHRVFRLLLLFVSCFTFLYILVLVISPIPDEYWRPINTGFKRVTFVRSTTTPFILLSSSAFSDTEHVFCCLWSP